MRYWPNLKTKDIVERVTPDLLPYYYRLRTCSGYDDPDGEFIRPPHVTALPTHQYKRKWTIYSESVIQCMQCFKRSRLWAHKKAPYVVHPCRHLAY